jgi:Na+/H+ antiporter NhaD/arsenite permease-like protein
VSCNRGLALERKTDRAVLENPALLPGQGLRGLARHRGILTLVIPHVPTACYPAADDMLLIPSTALPDARVAAAYVIFLASYLVFAIGKFPGLKIDRPGAAIIGAVAMIAFRLVPPSDAPRFIDFSTLVLLFSMMLIVGNLRLVGFLEWNAEAVLERLKPAHLLPAVIFTCGVLSAFLVNDIVCLVMVPFVLGITRRMRLQPLPYLLAVATASNTGSVATITGTPRTC